MATSLAMLVRNIDALVSKQDFDGACKLFRSIDVSTLPASLLMERSRAIQLAHDPAGLTLEHARSSLILATSLEPGCLQAWVDLGHFYFSVDNDVGKAIKAFREARSRAEPLMRDLADGEAKAMEELRRSTGE
jgi:hypothetical protein